MDFNESIRTCFSKYATFDGRAARAEFWWWTLFVVIAGSVLSSVDWMIFRGSSPQPLSGIFSLVTLLPGLAVGARRLHDIGRSGWFLLIGLIPLVGWIILIVWFVRESNPGPNEFGPNPYGN